MSKVVALFVADLHLSANPPVARSAESNWMDAQARPLRQLKELSAKHDCPVICAGDIFDKHNPSPALINWAIEHLPKMHAVPGQHDLSLHSLKDLKRSAYWTLMEAGIIDDIPIYPQSLSTLFETVGGANLTGFPFGVRVMPLEKKTQELEIAVTHSYIWTKGNEYVGAPNDNHLSGYSGRLEGYDVAVFGDNHKGFTARIGNCSVYNCGCLIRRKRDEQKYKPAVGLLYDDGHVERHYLDVSEDKWLEDDDELPLSEVDELGLDEFLNGLGSLDTERVGFADMIRRYVADGKASEGVGKVMLEALEETNHGDR